MGFIQYYCLDAHLPEGITRDSPLFKKYLSHEMAGMDLFIADNDNRGKGLGIQIIHQFITQFLGCYKAVVIDPERQNEQAIRCYKKSGFEMTNFSTDKTHCILILEKQPTD
jgi:aminoglycoside 6'-N-acetyltransferase